MLVGIMRGISKNLNLLQITDNFNIISLNDKNCFLSNNKKSGDQWSRAGRVTQSMVICDPGFLHQSVALFLMFVTS